MQNVFQDRSKGALIDKTLAVVLAGGNGTRLSHLTRWHSKPALPFGGMYRNIDFTLSNCVNSGVRRIGILTQYKAHSLIQHLQQGWQIFSPQLREFLEIWPAQQRLTADWYSGTADAVYQNIDIIKDTGMKYVIILAGDHIYKMDYKPLIHAHVASGAGMTIACCPVPASTASGFGVLSVDEASRVTAFTEKPTCPDTIPGRPGECLASMGIYVFDTDTLVSMLINDSNDASSNHDFGHDIVPTMISCGRASAYPFKSASGGNGYWRDVGTIASYWAANMDLLPPDRSMQLYDSEWPIHTAPVLLAPSVFATSDNHRAGVAIDSLVASGCTVTGSTVRHSVLSLGVEIQPGCDIQDSVLLPNVTVGRNCRLKKVIVDSDCVIPDGTVIGFDLSADAERFHIESNHVVLVATTMLEQGPRVPSHSRVASGAPHHQLPQVRKLSSA